MKTLIAIDGSDCSMRALDFITRRPCEANDQFMILSVVEPIPADFGFGMAPQPTATLEDRLFEECATVGGKAGRKLQEAFPENAVEVRVGSGLVANTICDSAAQWNADLIVMGSHGRKGISHFLLGSVAEEVLKKSPCSVEVIKAKGLNDRKTNEEIRTRRAS